MTEPLKLGLAGLGTVGGGVLRLLAERGPALAKAGRPVEIVAVSARDRRKDRCSDISGFRFVADPVELARDPGIDVFVELIGGEEGVAKESVETALRAGKHVITANKALLAHHGPALAALAEKHGVALNFEGAVAGGIPVVKVMRESLQGNTISRVYGILNGTCNYILSRMETEGLAFAACLADTVELGAPILRAGHQACHRPLGQRFADGHMHLVTLGDQAPIERTQIAGLGDSQHTH